MKKIFPLIYLLLSSMVAFSQWITLNSGTSMDLNSVYFTGVNTGYAVGVGAMNTIIKTTDGGTTWNALTGAPYYNLVSIHFPEEAIGYAVGPNGSIFRTPDAGSTWMDLSTAQVTLNSVFFTDSFTGYAVGSDPFGYGGVIIKTLDGGVNWTPQSSGTNNVLHSVYFTSADKGYAVGASGTILKTIDGGTNWIAVPQTGTMNQLESVHFPDENTGYAAGNYGTIVKTTDAGNTWVPLSSGTNQFLRSVFFTSPGTGFVVGNGGTSLKTVNGGASWVNFASGTEQLLFSVFFPDINTGYAVGTSGTILKTTNGGMGMENQSSGPAEVNIYPNPSSGTITIENSGEGHLCISNINGQELIFRQITEPKTQMDISSLPGGIYFIRITGDMTVQMGKFVKQ